MVFRYTISCIVRLSMFQLSAGSSMTARSEFLPSLLKYPHMLQPNFCNTTFNIHTVIQFSTFNTTRNGRSRGSGAGCRCSSKPPCVWMGCIPACTRTGCCPGWGSSSFSTLHLHSAEPSRAEPNRNLSRTKITSLKARPGVPAAPHLLCTVFVLLSFLGLLLARSQLELHSYTATPGKQRHQSSRPL